MCERNGKMKPDEREFLITYYQLNYPDYIRDKRRVTPREIINLPMFKHFMHYKRAWYLLDKWSSKGWYDWGVTLDLGWLTDEGIAKVKELLADENPNT